MDEALKLESGGRTKTMVLAGAVISAVTTIAVALIGVLPQIGGKPGVAERPPELQEAHWQIDGELSHGQASGESRSAEVLLIGAGSPYLTTTDSQGRFLFDEVPRGGYWLLVRHADSGLDARVLVVADDAAGAQAVALQGGAATVAIRLREKS